MKQFPAPKQRPVARYSNQAALRRTSRAVHRQAGWTFIETLIVIAIILLLSGTVGFMAVKALERGKVSAAANQVSALQNALIQYTIVMGSPPTKEEGGLKALVERPVGERSTLWPGRFLEKELPVDPWGRSFEYLMPGDASLPEGSNFGVRCLGADGRLGGEGNDADITTW